MELVVVVDQGQGLKVLWAARDSLSLVLPCRHCRVFKMQVQLPASSKLILRNSESTKVCWVWRYPLTELQS